MKTYWNAMNERERWMVVIGLFCLLAYGYYLLLYAPLSNQVKSEAKQLIEKNRTLAWMKKLTPPKNGLQNKQKMDNSQLLTLIGTKLKKTTLLKYPYQLQQTGTGDIQLSFDQVPFNAFIHWLIAINQHYALHVKQFDANNTDKSGLVKLMIIISANE